MKKALILGAGLVTKPLVRYLLEQPDVEVTVASRTLSKAEAMIGGHPKGRAIQWVVEDLEGLNRLVSEADVVVSMLPYIYHVTVAKVCLKHGKHLVTTSYVKPEMQALDEEARSKGLLFLNEIGLDPGIDHMSAMKIINGIKEKGGRVESFRSYCGALPAPEAADNPLKYKFGWSPRGVVLAGKNPARFLEDGKEVNIPGERLFEHYFTIEVNNLGTFEIYPNRDSIPYIDKYSIQGVSTMFRGTIRYPGWCRLWAVISRMGYLSEDEIECSGMTYREFTAAVMGCSPQQLENCLADRSGELLDDEVREKLVWIGMFSNEKVTHDKISPLDLLVEMLYSKMQYKEGERDMVILRHDVVGVYPDGKKKEFVSTLVDYGVFGKETSVARTVALPAAIATKLILDGKINLTGVHIPVLPEIYEPVLSELEQTGIKFEEEEKEL